MFAIRYSLHRYLLLRQNLLTERVAGFHKHENKMHGNELLDDNIVYWNNFQCPTLFSA